MTSPFSTRWDVYRDIDGNAVTVPCDYGHYDGDLTDEQLVAVRHAVDVWADVCMDTRSNQAYGAYQVTRFDWKHANMAKSRLLGRMIHHGLPPHDLPPPKAYAGGWWQVVEDGYALLPDYEVGNNIHDGELAICGSLGWQVAHATASLDVVLLELPRGNTTEPWRLRRATDTEIAEHNRVTTIRTDITHDEAIDQFGPWRWLERVPA